MQDEGEKEPTTKSKVSCGRKNKCCSCEQLKQTLAKSSRKNNHKNTLLNIDSPPTTTRHVYVNNDLEACDLDAFLTFSQRTGAKLVHFFLVF